MKNKSSQTIHIACYDTDQSCRMKPAAFMDYAQELAGDNAEMLGFGYDELIGKGLVWIISRMKMRFHRLPSWRENVTLTTWHRGFDGPFYLRDYQMKDKDGNTLAQATSSWVILDIDQRRVVRTTYGEDPRTICPEAAVEQPCKRMRIPHGTTLEDAGTHVVRYSDIDKNLHANNVMYIVWATDVLDREYVNTHPVRELEVDFISEAMPDDVVTLRKVEIAKDIWMVAGYIGDRESFIARFDFTPEQA